MNTTMNTTKDKIQARVQEALFGNKPKTMVEQLHEIQKKRNLLVDALDELTDAFRVAFKDIVGHNLGFDQEGGKLGITYFPNGTDAQPRKVLTNVVQLRDALGVDKVKKLFDGKIPTQQDFADLVAMTSLKEDESLMGDNDKPDSTRPAGPAKTGPAKPGSIKGPARPKEHFYPEGDAIKHVPLDNNMPR